MKKNVFTRIVALVAVIAVSVCLLAGCGKDVTLDDQGRVIVSVGDWPSKNGTDLDNINARKERFEQVNTDIVITPDVWVFDRKTFYAKAAGGQLPTLYSAGFTEVPEIISSEYSADLTDVLKKRGYEGILNENILSTISDADGKIRVFPSSCYVLGLSFNVDLMKAAGLMEADGTPMQPKTWDELAEFAVKIKKATGKAGFVFPTASKNGGWMFSPVAWSYGVDFMEKDKDGKWQATFNTPECVAALQYIKDLKWKYDVLPGNTLVDGTEMYKIFATGNAGMLISSGGIPNTVIQYGMKPDQLGIMAIPAGPKRHVTLLGGNVQCVKEGATDDQIDGAIRWLETAISYKISDEYKTNAIESIEQQIKDGKLVGIKNMSIWSSKSEAVSWLNQKIDEYANSNPNHIRLYNEFVADCPAEIQPEEPVCAQELYEILDSCIQEVLIDENADCAQLIANAASDFQANYLDNLIY